MYVLAQNAGWVVALVNLEIRSERCLLGDVADECGKYGATAHMACIAAELRIMPKNSSL